MATRRKLARTLMIPPWIVEERGQRKHKIMEDGGMHQWSLREVRPGTWNASGISSAGSQVRKTYGATSVEQAVRMGAALLYPEEFGRQESAGRTEISVAEGLALAIKASMGQAEHKRNMLSDGMAFTDFCDGKGLRWWHQLRRPHINAYVAALADEGYARRTIQHRVAVVTAAARAVVAMYPEEYFDFASGYRLRRDLGVSGHYSPDDGKVALTIQEVMQLLAWLEGQPRGRLVQLQVMLSALCGLRVREVIYLTWRNVDLEGGWITVEKEDGHKVKTLESIRRIPIPRFVIEFLRELRQSGPRVMNIDVERLYVWDMKKPKLRADEHAYLAMANRLLAKWRSGITTRTFRKTLMNACLTNASWNALLVDRYCGHAPTSVMAKHYFESQKSRLEDLYRQEVVPLVEAEIDRVLASEPGLFSKKKQRTETPLDQAGARIVALEDVG